MKRKKYSKELKSKVAIAAIKGTRQRMRSHLNLEFIRAL